VCPEDAIKLDQAGSGWILFAPSSKKIKKSLAVEAHFSFYFHPFSPESA
jgi:hypothetical protein